MVTNENTIIKEWYKEKFPDDELGSEIVEKATFNDIFLCLDAYKSIYKKLGIYDSVVRERIFEELSKIMKCDYNYIYEQWLKGE